VADATDPLAALARLRAASRALAQASGIDAVVATLIERTLDALDALGALVAIPRDDDTLEILAASHPPGALARVDGAPLTQRWPLTDALRTGRPVWCSSRDDIIEGYPETASFLIAEAYIALPLHVGARVIGVLGIGFNAPQEFDEPQRLYLLALADMCAMVLDQHVLDLRGSETRLRALVDSNVVGIVSGDSVEIGEANDAFLTMVGLSRSALASGVDFRTITAPEYADADARAIAQADATGRFGPYEKEFVHADGRRIPVRVVGAVLSAEGRWMAIIEDLSEERAVQAELRAKESRYRSLAEATNTIVWSADPAGRFVEPNASWSHYTGQSDADARGHGWLGALQAEDRERVFRALDEARAHRRPWTGPAKLWHAASETERHIEVRAVPLLDDNGEIFEWVGTVSDIEEQTRTEQVLRATTARLGALMRNAPVGFAFIVDRLRFQVVNDKLAEINGIPAEGHLGRDVRDVVPGLSQVSESHFRRVLAGEPALETEVRGTNADAPDDPRDWLVNYYPVHDPGGVLLGIGVTVLDVTDRNRLLAAEVAAGVAIAGERGRLAAILERMPAGLVVIDASDGPARVELSNARAVEVLGTPGAPVDTWFALRDPAGRAIAPADSPMHRALAGETGTEPLDALVHCPDGRTAHVRVSAAPIRDVDQRVSGAVIVIEDVTEHARRERDAQLLARVTELIGTVDDLDVMLDRIVGLSVPLFADACALFVLDDTGEACSLRAVAHVNPVRVQEMRDHFSVPLVIAESLGAQVVVGMGETILMETVTDDFYSPAFHPFQSAWMRETFAPQSALGVPLRIKDRVIGLLALFQTPDSTRRFTDGDVSVAIDLASRCGLVLDQMLAHRETRRARDRADRLQKFAASAARAASVDAVVRAIATDGVAAADGYVVNIAMRVEHDSPSQFVRTRRLHPGDSITWDPVPPDANDSLITALGSGRPGFYRTRAAYEAQFPGSDKVLRLNDARAVACLPLLDSDGHVIGAIGYTFRAEQAFNDDQRVLLETVADVAAQSLDRARLYEQERDVAGALQRALLPSALPELDGVETEARYVAGGRGVSVGGDWYDVLRFVDGRVGLLIGDAAGRGVEAATLMGKVRHAAAALAMDHESPAVVLARVNEFLHTISTRRDMVTCCYFVLDHDRGILRYSSAGHPPALLLENGRAPVFLEGARGVPLGVIPTAAYPEATYALNDAATLVLYTDGLIERRGETIDVGLERLVATTEGHDDDINALCDRLTTTLLGDNSEDDVALLVARVCAVPARGRLDLELPADSRRLHELRARVTRWLTDAGVAPAVIPEVVIALNEAASNSMVHAYAGTAERGHVKVSLALAESALTATVSDEGNWRDKGPLHDGRGLEMMHALMTEVEVERDANGTRVKLTREMVG
jgi:PAS domain S-box-containing protein